MSKPLPPGLSKMLGAAHTSTAPTSAHAKPDENAAAEPQNDAVEISEVAARDKSPKRKRPTAAVSPTKPKKKKSAKKEEPTPHKDKKHKAASKAKARDEEKKKKKHKKTKHSSTDDSVYVIFSQRRKRNITKPARRDPATNRITFEVQGTVCPIMDGFNFKGVNDGDVLEIKNLTKSSKVYKTIDLARYNLRNDPDWHLRADIDDEEDSPHAAMLSDEDEADYEPKVDSVASFSTKLRETVASFSDKRRCWRFDLEVRQNPSNNKAGICITGITVKPKCHKKAKLVNGKTAKQRALEKELADLMRS